MEKGKRSQLAYSFNIALQNELIMEENVELAREFCREQFVSREIFVDMAVHEGESSDPEIADNPHFHVLVPLPAGIPRNFWKNGENSGLIKLMQHSGRKGWQQGLTAGLMRSRELN